MDSQRPADNVREATTGYEKDFRRSGLKVLSPSDNCPDVVDCELHSTKARQHALFRLTREMKKRRSIIPPDPYAGYVEHPRYGRRPRFTCKPDPVEQGWSGPHFHFHSRPGERIAGTAIAADLARQCPATIAVTHYFDTKRVCLDCHRPFIFFAAEQKHWYETLRFPLEANCVRCPACRKRTQVLSRARRDHDILAKVQPRTTDQSLAMADCVLTLVEAGIFPPRQLEKVRMLLKRIHAHEHHRPRYGELTERLTAATTALARDSKPE